MLGAWILAALAGAVAVSERVAQALVLAQVLVLALAQVLVPVYPPAFADPVQIPSRPSFSAAMASNTT